MRVLVPALAFGCLVACGYRTPLLDAADPYGANPGSGGIASASDAADARRPGGDLRGDVEDARDVPRRDARDARPDVAAAEAISGCSGNNCLWGACGNGLTETAEGCDDGNTTPFDGCSMDCQVEPDCSGTSCTSSCGDGILVNEECDDGNRASGDGCSSDCRVEPGWTCTQPELGETMAIPTIHRDFDFQKPTDFQPLVLNHADISEGMVLDTLDGEGKPRFSGVAGPGVAIASATTFSHWYRTVDGLNRASARKLQVWRDEQGSYVNRYGSDGEQWVVSEPAYWCGVRGEEQLDADGSPIPCTYRYGKDDCAAMAAKGREMVPGSCKLKGDTYQASFVVKRVDGNPVFFPVDDVASGDPMTGAHIPSLPLNMYEISGSYPPELDATGNQPLHNFSFTSELRHWFKYETGRTYTLWFVGDDDLWVFINKRLAVDLGGIHYPSEKSLTFDSKAAAKLELVSGRVYEIAVFFAERQSTCSSLKVTFPPWNSARSQCLRN